MFRFFISWKTLYQRRNLLEVEIQSQLIGSGDRNTTFFHRSVSARRKRNGILGPYNADNHFKNNQKDMENIVTNFYSGLFTSQNSDQREI